MKQFQPTRAHPEQFNISSHRPFIVFLIILLVVFTGAFIGACSSGTSDHSVKPKEEQENKMSSKTIHATDNQNKPPIDAAAPSDTLTATFALG